MKNMKHIAILALPVMALSLTSCGKNSKKVTYEEMRNYAADHYDVHAIDTVPSNFVINFNKMQAEVLVKYSTPTGGSDSFTIGFGYNGIHVTLKDRYAYSLSSTLIDTIERYYSDFVSFVVKLQEEPPLELGYSLTNGGGSRVDLTTRNSVTGATGIRMLQFVVSTIDSFSASFGYIPNPEKTPIKNELLIEVFDYLYSIKIIRQILQNDNIAPYIYDVINYLTLVISEDSESHGNVFNTYITTDSYGFINQLDFNFKSSFNILGLAQFKSYDKAEPEEGDRPTDREAPYSFSLTGSFDFDFDISTKYVG